MRILGQNHCMLLLGLDSGQTDSGYMDSGSKDAAKGNVAYRNAAKQNGIATIICVITYNASFSNLNTNYHDILYIYTSTMLGFGMYHHEKFKW